MCGDQGVDELATALDHGVDFTTASTEVRIVVEGLPQVVDGLAAGLRTGVDENTNFRLQHLTNGVEQPTVRVDLLLVLRLDDEDDLDWHEVVRIVTVRDDKLRCRINRQLCCVLYKAIC